MLTGMQHMITSMLTGMQHMITSMRTYQGAVAIHSDRDEKIILKRNPGEIGRKIMD
jgi:hypothetical protein